MNHKIQTSFDDITFQSYCQTWPFHWRTRRRCSAYAIKASNHSSVRIYQSCRGRDHALQNLFFWVETAAQISSRWRYWHEQYEPSDRSEGKYWHSRLLTNCSLLPSSLPKSGGSRSSPRQKRVVMCVAGKQSGRDGTCYCRLMSAASRCRLSLRKSLKATQHHWNENPTLKSSSSIYVCSLCSMCLLAWLNIVS